MTPKVESVPLRRLFTVINGGTPTPDPSNWAGGVPWATPVDLAKVDGHSIVWTERTLTDEGLRTGSRVVPPGSIIVSTRAPIGYVATANQETAFNQGCRGLVPTDPRAVDVRFVKYQLLARRKDLQSAGNGTTFQELPGEALASFQVLAPPKEQQRRIADFLDAETARIDALITAKQRMIDLSLERDEVALSTWWQEAAARFGTTSIRRLGAVVEQGWSPACLSEPAPEGQWGVLKTSAVTGSQFDPLANKCLPAGAMPDLRWKVQPGDLLMVRGSGSRRAVGAVAVADPGDRLLTISDLLYRIRGLDGLPEFHAAALRSRLVRQIIERTFRTDAGQTLKLRSDDIRDLPHPVVPVDRMAAVLAELSDQTGPSNVLRSLLAQQIALLRERRQALITAAVTGELEI